MATPFLKWAGSKRKLASALAGPVEELLKARGGYYVEPFLGGGAVALLLDWHKKALGDAEEDLMLTWVTVRDEVEELINMLNIIIGCGTDEEQYLHVRATPTDTSIETAAKTIYLNKLCFNGLYRKNSKGEFNVPYGKNPHREVFDPDHLREVSAALQGVELFVGDFQTLVDGAGEGDVVYIDPPYDGVYNGYSPGGFGEAEQTRLAERLYAAVERGAAVIAHNTDTELTRYLYSEWTEIEVVDERRSVAANGTKRGDARCILATAGV